MVMDYDVAIVGAGLSGLTAARTLSAAGRSVLVLDAADHVGGRASTVHEGDTFIDNGGQWIGREHHRVLALLDEFGIERFDFYSEGDHLVLRSGELARWTGESPLRGDDLAELQRVEMQFASLVAGVDICQPLAGHGRDLDRISAGEWLNAQTSNESVRDWFTMHVRTDFCSEAAEVSMLGLALAEITGPTTGDYEAFRIDGGAQQLPLRLAADLGEAVRLNQPVLRIATGDGCVTLQTVDGIITASHAIVATSPQLANRITYEPPLTAARDQLIQRMPMGTVLKFHAVYPEPFWRHEGLSGSALVMGSTIGQTADNSPPDGSVGVLGSFIFGAAARRWLQSTLGERRSAVLADLVTLFGEGALDPLHFEEANWSANQWVRGGYDAVPMPGALHLGWENLRCPQGRVLFAGTETSVEWPGYYEGAIAAGERAAAEALASE